MSAVAVAVAAFVAESVAAEPEQRLIEEQLCHPSSREKKLFKHLEETGKYNKDTHALLLKFARLVLVPCTRDHDLRDQLNVDAKDFAAHLRKLIAKCVEVRSCTLCNQLTQVFESCKMCGMDFL